MSIGADAGGGPASAGLTVGAAQRAAPASGRRSSTRSSTTTSRVCGGDFYARGHIRSIAKVVGLDPGRPSARTTTSTAARPRRPGRRPSSRPRRTIKIRERRGPTGPMALAVALAIVVGVRRGAGCSAAAPTGRGCAPPTRRRVPPNARVAAAAPEPSHASRRRPPRHNGRCGRRPGRRPSAASYLDVSDGDGHAALRGDAARRARRSTWSRQAGRASSIGNAGGGRAAASTARTWARRAVGADGRPARSSLTRPAATGR